MNSKDKIKLITAYKEIDTGDYETFHTMYMSLNTKNKEEINNEIKNKNRAITLDIILGKRPEKDFELKEEYFTDIDYISPEIKNMDINLNKLETYDKVYLNIIKYIDSETDKTIIVQDLNLKTLNIKFVEKCKKITSKIIAYSSYIAANGRIGSANCLIYGKDLKKYFEYIIKNNLLSPDISLIFDDNIKQNKIILLRRNEIDSQGIVFIDDKVNLKCGFNYTDNWKSQFCWFRVYE